MNEREIMAELISGGLKCHFAVLAIVQAIVSILIALVTIVISVVELAIGFLIIFTGFLRIATFLLTKYQEERRYRYEQV